LDAITNKSNSNATTITPANNCLKPAANDDNQAEDDISNGECRCNEEIKLFDYIMYYESICPGGDPRGRKEAYVTAIRPNEYFKLILSTGDMITGTMGVKRLKTKVGDEWIDNPNGGYWPTEDFILEEAGASSAVSDAASYQGGCFSRNFNDKARAMNSSTGFAPLDFVQTLTGGQGALPVNYDDTWSISLALGTHPVHLVLLILLLEATVQMKNLWIVAENVIPITRAQPITATKFWCKRRLDPKLNAQSRAVHASMNLYLSAVVPSVPGLCTMLVVTDLS